ncbi:MAG TPA: lasso peptide biosynthesis B2 protein [Polyangiaceae bacterium]
MLKARLHGLLLRPRSGFERSLEPIPENSLLAKALMLHAAVEMGLRTVRLPTLCRLLGLRVGAQRGVSERADRGPVEEQSVAVCRAVDRVLQGLEVQGPCLRRALVAGALLRKQQPVLRIGCRRIGNRLESHAWLEIDGRPLPEPDGQPSFPAYAPLGRAPHHVVGV